MLRQDFNKGWKFGQSVSPLMALVTGNKPEPLKDVTLPHDAMILTDRSPDYPTGGGSAYFKAENYEYSKALFIPEEDKGKVIYLEFEGVYMNAFVWVNGDLAGKCPYGYSNFYVKINDYLNYGKENEIKVTVKNATQPNARWYSGAGIYRNVKIIKGQPLHIKVDGVRITTPEIDKELAVVEVATDVGHEVLGHESGYVVTEICDPDGKVVATEKTKFNILSDQTITVRQRLYVNSPKLWDVDDPHLYTCESKIVQDDSVIDEDINTFGIRKLQLDPINGLRINGKTVKLKGGCIHHDNGLLGAATFEDAEERRVRLLKEAGYNSIRMAHHPISRALLDACDRIGMLVMDEFSDVWTQTKCDFDYGFHFTEWWEEHVEAMVRKDFNHPSVIFYSIGNEIPEAGSDISASWGRKIAEKIRSLDNTRYVTNGINALLAVMGRMNEIVAAIGAEEAAAGADANEINQLMNNLGALMGKITSHPLVDKAIEESCDMLDAVGYNYAAERYEKDHAAHPNRILVGSETYPATLDENWELVEKHGYVLGDYSWTAWDYLGEVGIGHVGYDDDRNPSFYGVYPWITAYCADFDITGYRRPISYWREIIWGGRDHVPYIAVQRPERYGQQSYPGRWSWTDSISSWTWPGFEGKGAVVEVYSDAEEIELFINGKSQGRKPVGDEFKKFYCKFDTKYEAGTVEAVAYIGSNEVGRYSLKTAGEPVLNVTPETSSIRAGSNDLCYVNIELVDKDGVLNTSVKKSVTVSIEGPATIHASGSGNPRMEEYYYENTHETFYGRMLAIVRAGIEKGTAKLTVSAEGMDSVTVEIPVV
jgi:beta-galactosidase